MKNQTPKLASPLEKQLNDLRERIDQADQQLIEALSLRFKAVAKVGKLKQRQGLPLYQKARWEAVVLDRLKSARRKNVDEDFMKSLLRLIHKEAIRIQKGKS